MPLVIITGYPSSGKTYRAHQIEAALSARVTDSSTNTERSVPPTVTVLPSHHSSRDPPYNSKDTEVNATQYLPPDPVTNPRDVIYESSGAEKTARAEEFSAIKRAVSKNNIVIADSPNYIKGFRYQLWCEAKAAGTRCIVVHVAAREDECIRWNEARLKIRGWAISGDDDGDEGRLYSAHSVSAMTGPRVGRDVLGDLEPTSHTALYGDRLADLPVGSRSRSSSMGGGISDEDQARETKEQGKSLSVDNMTLKSLYISDRPDEWLRSDQDLGRDSHENKQKRLSETLTQQTVANVSNIPNVPPPSPESSLPYAPSTLKSLLMRYEPPSPFTRWDTPLFTVPSSDTDPPYDAIWDALFPPPNKQLSKKARSQLSRTDLDGNMTALKPSEAGGVRPNAATTLPKATSADALQTLEAATADVVKHLLGAAREAGLANGEGGHLVFSVPVEPGSTFVPGASHTDTDNDIAASKSPSMIEIDVALPLNTPLSQPLLQRLRRKYTQIQRGSIAHGRGYAQGRSDVVKGFVGFLDAEWSE